jgi:hypothetical protein
VTGIGWVAREPILRCAHDPPLLPRGNLVQAASSVTFASMKARCLPLERDEVDLPDWRLIALRHDAMTLEAEQKRGDGLGEETSAIGFCPRPLAWSLALPLDHQRELVYARAGDLQHLCHAPHCVA